MLLDKAVHDTQAESLMSATFRAFYGMEEMAQNLRGNSGTVVDDADLDIQGTVPVHVAIVDDLDFPGRMNGFDGILHEIDQDLFEWIRGNIDFRRKILCLDDNLYGGGGVLGIAEQPRHVADNPIDFGKGSRRFRFQIGESANDLADTVDLLVK